MQYEGNLYGKVGRRYIPLTATTGDFDSLEAKCKTLETELAELKAKSVGTISLNTLFEVQTFHGNEAVFNAVLLMLLEHKKTIQFPYPVSANNGDDIVYIHEDGHTTWNTKE